jgi:hypothetical protein
VIAAAPFIRHHRAGRISLTAAFVCLVIAAGASEARAEAPSIAFFYGRPVPPELSAFDQVVLESENVDSADLSRLARGGARPFAYVSVSEVDRTRSWYKDVDRHWFIGGSRGWNSDIVDPANPAWREFLLGRMAALWGQGWRGFFLDTLDGYEAVIAGDKERAERVRALVELLRAMHRRFPGVKVIINRGFEVLPEAHDLVAGVVAESLFVGWEPEKKRYRPVPPSDREWLLPRLQEARDRYHLPVTVIEYLPTEDRAGMREAARRVAALRFVPWVSNFKLDMLGVGTLEVVPRRILFLHDGAEAGSLADSPAHRLGTTPIDWLGYAVDYVDARGELPEGTLAGRYAGIVTWFTDDELPRANRLRAFLLRHIDEGVRVAILGRFGWNVDHGFLAKLDLEEVEAPKPPLRVASHDELLGFETQVQALGGDLRGLKPKAPSMTVHAQLEDAAGKKFAVVMTGRWGGVAVDPYVLETGYGGRFRWRLDPFQFLRRALGLPDAPVFDATTENGARLMTAHIDGDGIVSRAELPGTEYAGQVILDQVLKVFPVPTTVSVIEGEVAPWGSHPADSAEVEAIARRIFALPFVEVASHTYSHPFYWSKAAHESAGGEVFHLKLPGYRYDMRREVDGSVEYINKRLVPQGKPVRVMLWSGDALPDADAVEQAGALGLWNVNGGNTAVTRENPSMTDVSPMILPLGRAIQVYAPVQNENVYTELWHGPFYGFRRVIETFELTDTPYRLKPISIYYHFYSGTKRASLDALRDVYRWALERDVLPIYLSEFAERALEFQGAVVLRGLGGEWHLRGAKKLRTVRLPAAMGWPDFERSRGVVGVRDLPQGRYVSLGGDGRVTLVMTPTAPPGPYLERANAQVLSWAREEGGKVALRLRGGLPVRLRVGGVKECRVASSSGEVPKVASGGAGVELSFAQADTGEVRLGCR